MKFGATPLDVKTFEAFLLYAYTGTVSLSQDNISHMLRLCDYMQVKALLLSIKSAQGYSLLSHCPKM